MCTLIDLTGACGKNVPPGVRTRVFFVPEEEVATYPNPLTTTGPGDSQILDGDIILEPLSYFRQVDIVVKEGEVKDTLVGEVGGKSWETMFEFIIAGVGPVETEFAACLANGCPLILIPDKEAQVRSVGEVGNPAYADAIELTTGKASGDRKGGTYAMKFESGTPAKFYTGVIDLDPST